MKEMTPVVSVFFQAVHMEMEEALHEKDELKLRVHSYISEVSRIEKLMATKVGNSCSQCLSLDDRYCLCEALIVVLLASLIAW